MWYVISHNPKEPEDTEVAVESGEAICFPDEEQALDYIDELRKEFPDYKHKVIKFDSI